LRGERWRTSPPPIESLEDLLSFLSEVERLWRTPFIVGKVYPEKMTLFRRDLKYRAWLIEKRFEIALRSLPKKCFKVKGKRARHVVITITVKHEGPLHESYKKLSKRLQAVVRYFKKRYGLVGYIAVLEVHADGYGHYHAIIFTKRWLKVFKHKNVWRFDDKRNREKDTDWDRDLRVDEEGFIDCFALKNGKEGAKSYFAKYLTKALSRPSPSSSPSSTSNEESSVNVKDKVLLVARALRIQVLKMSRNIARAVNEELKKMRQAYRGHSMKDLDEIERQLYELGELLVGEEFKDLRHTREFDNVLRMRLDILSQDLAKASSHLILRKLLERGELMAVFQRAVNLYLETPLGGFKCYCLITSC